MHAPRSAPLDTSQELHAHPLAVVATHAVGGEPYLLRHMLMLQEDNVVRAEETNYASARNLSYVEVEGNDYF